MTLMFGCNSPLLSGAANQSSDESGLSILPGESQRFICPQAILGWIEPAWFCVCTLGSAITHTGIRKAGRKRSLCFL